MDRFFTGKLFNWRAASMVLWFAGCLLLSASSAFAEEKDPWEGFNRAITSFNDTADRWVTRPLAKGYKAVTPDAVESGIANVFDNILEPRNIINDVLQGKLSGAANDSGRFLINTTIGLGGIFDIAKHVGLEKSDGEDFGQTLAVWGIGQGPYLVLPFFGPSSLRGLPGNVVDSYSTPLRYIDHVPTRNSANGMNLIDTRAELLQAEELIHGDRYIFIRDAYLQRREYLIKDGVIEDDFGDFDDEYGDDDF